MIKQFAIIVSLLLSLTGNCQDISDSAIRLNPEIEQGGTLSAKFGVDYPYLNLDKNHINFNNADWSNVCQLLNDIDSTTLTIVHIGDSHLQADIATSHTRQLLQKQYGNAGRGLIIPFKMANTNEPRDYSITSNNSWTASTIMRQPWLCPMGFTGISLSPNTQSTDLTISTCSRNKKQTFQSVRLFKKGDIAINQVGTSKSDSCQIYYEKDYIDLLFSDTTSCINLNLEFAKSASIWGADLATYNTGIVYHTIGNNGATYDNYNRIPDFADQLSILSPDLIIISLGANEAFGNMSDITIRNSIDKLVTDLRNANPLATILLSTPMECYKYQYVKRKGKRRYRTYIVNEKTHNVRQVILDYARDNNIAVYDWFNVAGGKGAGEKWVNDNLLSRDRIHSTVKGYELQGTLFYHALQKGITNNR